MKPVFNEIGHLYELGIQENNGLYVCPVCSKRYKRLSMANKHLEKMNCHSYEQLFKNTSSEEKMYDIYINIQAIENNPVVGVRKFRKNRYYATIGRLVSFLYFNKIEYHYDYIQWVLENKPWKHIMGALSICCEESVLREYRKHKQKNITREESERFYGRYSSMLVDEPSFALRALERGEIGYNHLFEWIDADTFIKALTGAEKKRLEIFLKGVE